jgi:hypothetical protein
MTTGLYLSAHPLLLAGPQAPLPGFEKSEYNTFLTSEDYKSLLTAYVKHIIYK